MDREIEPVDTDDFYLESPEVAPFTQLGQVGLLFLRETVMDEEALAIALLWTEFVVHLALETML